MRISDWSSDVCSSDLWNLSGGLGYKVVDNKKMTLSLKGGPAFRQTAFVDGGNDTELTALAGLDFGWQLSPTLRLTQVASPLVGTPSSEERRVGKGCVSTGRSRG